MNYLPLIRLFEFSVKNNLAGVAIGGFVAALGLVALGMSQWLTYHRSLFELVGIATFAVGVTLVVIFFIAYFVDHIRKRP
jgi:hypothetical protein